MKLGFAAIVFALNLLLSGCAGLTKSAGETALFALETPTLEAAANRGAIATSLLRVNHLVLTDLPISANASWPKQMAEKPTEQHKFRVRQALAQDPWYATRGATGLYLLQNLGGFIPPDMSPLAYEAFKKIDAVYGEDYKNWPDIWTYSSGLKNFLSFADKYQPAQIEAIDGSYFPNIHSALISLMPVNFQKDLALAGIEYQTANANSSELKQLQEEIKTILEAKPGTENYQYLDAEQRKSLQEQQQVLAVQIKQAEELEDEKQQVYLTLLEQAAEQLKSEIDLDPSKTALAQNIYYALQSVKEGSTHAISLYTLATTSIVARGALENIHIEMQAMLAAPLIIPSQADLIGKRIERLAHNAIYLLPAIGMGNYHAYKQNNLANKYLKVVEVIVDATKAQEKTQAKSQAKLDKKSAKQLAKNQD